VEVSAVVLSSALPSVSSLAVLSPVEGPKVFEVRVFGFESGVDVQAATPKLPTTIKIERRIGSSIARPRRLRAAESQQMGEDCAELGSRVWRSPDAVASYSLAPTCRAKRPPLISPPSSPRPAR